MGVCRTCLLAVAALCILAAPILAGEEAALPTRAANALAKLRAAKTLDASAVGEGGDKTDTYRAYEVLRDTAPAPALVVLTGDKNPIVRCYAFRALAAKHPDTDVFPILWRHLDDFEQVETFRGCELGGEQVGDVMMDDARDRLDGKQARRVLEHLLRTKSPLLERARLLRSTTVPADLLPALRRLSDSGDEDALVAIARHGLEEDVARIETRLRRPDQSVHPELLPALLAASLHRDPRLLPALEALAPRVLAGLRKKTPYRFRFYYAALAAQPSKRAADRLDSLLDAKGLSRHAHATLSEVFSRPFAPPRRRATFRCSGVSGTSTVGSTWMSRAGSLTLTPNARGQVSRAICEVTRTASRSKPRRSCSRGWPSRTKRRRRDL